MFTLNLLLSLLLWSNDYGRNWSWADWTFETSFGCPTFLNFGQHYDGARDEFVYIYSPDAPTAYQLADGMVMARVPKDQLKDWRQYRYFAGWDGHKRPIWSEDIRKRQAVFSNPGKCYRSGISFNAGLGKYLWCQIIPLATDEEGPRFAGGLGIFAASEPWGPWETVYYTREWDVGPGETASIPPKWMSADGERCYLLFSGDDHFSVREIRFRE